MKIIWCTVPEIWCSTDGWTNRRTEEWLTEVGAAPKKWVRKDELSKEWTSFIDNCNAQAGKNRTFHKTYKQNIPARLLTTGCNTAIENLAILVEKHRAKRTENIPTKINDPYHLIDNFETLNAKSITDNAILNRYTWNMSNKYQLDFRWSKSYTNRIPKGAFLVLTQIWQFNQ